MNTKLTPREREVLEVLAFGNSQKEAAYLLDCKTGTIDSHVKHIKEKTGLQKITELECAWLFKKYRLPVIDIPERVRKRIAAALLVLSVFTCVFQTSDMLRVFRGNGRLGARTINVRGARRGSKKNDFQLNTI